MCKNNGRIVIRKKNISAYERQMLSVERSIAKSLFKSLQEIQKRVSLQKLEAELESGLISYFDGIIDWNFVDDVIKETMSEAITAGVILGAEHELEGLPKLTNKSLRAGIIDEIVPEIPFTLANPRITAFLAKRVQDIGSKMVNANVGVIERVVRLNFEKGYTPKQISTIIRSSIGLNEPQSIALNNYAGGLYAKGASELKVAKEVASYGKRLINQRALTIARTEVMLAVNTGQTEVWKEAFSSGYAEKDEFEKVWNTAVDDLVCDICAPLDQQAVEVDGEFSGDIDDPSSPPAHANCRCLKELRKKR